MGRALWDPHSLPHRPAISPSQPQVSHRSTVPGRPQSAMTLLLVLSATGGHATLAALGRQCHMSHRGPLVYQSSSLLRCNCLSTTMNTGIAQLLPDLLATSDLASPTSLRAHVHAACVFQSPNMLGTLGMRLLVLHVCFYFLSS